jgi:KAP family P-loop domain
MSREFVAMQWRRLTAGCGLGCLIAIAGHLLWRDKLFVQTLHQKLAAFKASTMFDGVNAYKLEVVALCVVVAAALAMPTAAAIWRYLRAWWAGIVSLTVVFSAFVTVMLLWHAPLTVRSTVQGLLLVSVVIFLELWRSGIETTVKSPGRRMPSLKIPAQNRESSVEARWELSSSDDPIMEWSQDIIGRASVVELLVERIFVHHTPIVALNGGLGDGKSSVLRLLRRSLAGQAITVSFSTWLPGSEETLAVDLFRDIATECRRMFYIPQLRKRAIAYARTITGSVSYLAGLREILPAQSQQQEIEELRDTLAHVPVPIVVLLDEIDRMQREELVVLLKILRGASSIPNVTFICAFSDEEITKLLSGDATLSYGYLEKFFPVSVNLAAPEPSMIGRLLQAQIKAAARQGNWFLGTNEKTFGELLERMWQESLSRICTNLRKTSLLLNDLSASGRIIGREVNTLDLVGIETIRRFSPKIYQLVRKNPAFLTYGSNSWMKHQYVSDERKKKEAAEFFALLEGQLTESEEPQAFGYVLALLFPAFNASRGTISMQIIRPTDAELAEKEQRISDSDYFEIYFQSAVPEDMFSVAELTDAVARFNKATTEMACEQIFKKVLNGIPQHHAKRTDFLWKIGRAVESLLDGHAAEWIAYAAASRATDYAYDLVNIGEAARALNIVFHSAQRFSQSSKAQEILEGAIKRATDDTFALRLLDFTERRDRNKILTNFSFIDATKLRAVFIERMRQRYGVGVDASKVDIATGDSTAFRYWVQNSAEDQKSEADFWRGYIGASRKRLAQAINFIYPGGYTWSEDPSKWIASLVPVDELRAVLENSKDKEEELTEIESSAIVRFQQLLKGKWFDIARPGSWAEANTSISQGNEAARVDVSSSATSSPEDSRAAPPANPKGWKELDSPGNEDQPLSVD